MKPRALPPGGRIAVVSPAAAAKEDLVRAGMDALSKLGYEPVLMPHALDRGPLYYAGALQDRLADLHAAFADTSIDAIACTRGGWGSAELLPHLDAKLVRANPKPFLGYSDHTSLHAWFTREAGLNSFYAPMVAADFSREGGVHLPSWKAALGGESAWSLGAAEGMRVLKTGKAEGTLFGGCLAIVAESLGTPYAMQPPAGDGILFLEDIDVKPYQWDRMLLHLRYAGLLDRVKGIVFGDMRACLTAHGDSDLLEKALLHALRDFKGPIAIGLQSGHVASANVTVPLGVHARLEGDQLTILEPCVA